MPPFEDFLGMSHWDDTLGKTQKLLMDLFSLSGIGMPWEPQEEFKNVTGRRDDWVSLLHLLHL